MKNSPLETFLRGRMCLFVLFSFFFTFQTQASITPVNPQKGDPTWEIVSKLGTQADELVPIHLQNESLIEVIDTNVKEGFSGTWTAIAALVISACDLTTVYENFRETWTVLDEMETKIDDGFAGTWTAIDAISASCEAGAVSGVTCSPTEAKVVVPVDNLVRQAGSFAAAGNHVIVGAFKVNSMAENVTVNGTGVRDLLTASGDYLAYLLDNGDIAAMGFTAADTGTAAQLLIDALEALLG